MQYAYDLGGASGPLIRTLKIGETFAVPGIYARMDTNAYGHVMMCETNSFAEGVGVALNAATYTATPTAATEGTVDCVCNPFAVYRLKCSGATTAGTVMTTANLFTQTAASATVITSAAVPAYTANAGSTIFCLSGVNAGLSRVVVSHVDSVSATVQVAFPATVAVGDKLVVVPFGIGRNCNLTLTSNLLEADCTVEIGTGGECGVVDVELETPPSTTDPQVYVYIVTFDSVWNPVD